MEHPKWLFLYKIKELKKDSYSKCEVLPFISRIFDPYRLLGLITTKAKNFMQQLWSAKFEWDDLLPVAMAKDWQSFVLSLTNLENLHIPRFIFYETCVVVHRLAISISAYGVVIYVQNLLTIGAPNHLTIRVGLL